jgi:hypothetical protein
MFKEKNIVLIMNQYKLLFAEIYKFSELLGFQSNHTKIGIGEK